MGTLGGEGRPPPVRHERFHQGQRLPQVHFQAGGQVALRGGQGRYFFKPAPLGQYSGPGEVEAVGHHHHLGLGRVQILF